MRLFVGRGEIEFEGDLAADGHDGVVLIAVARSARGLA
jgi:hypothetical protein